MAKRASDEGSAGSAAGDGASDLVGDVVSVVRDGVISAVAGVVGVAAMIAVLFVASALGAFEFESIGGLATVLGLGFEGDLFVGYAILVGGGTTAWPLLFVAIGERLPGGETPLRGVSFATVIWTGFVAAFYTGQQGVALASYALSTLLAHWAYGFGLGSAFDCLADRVDEFPSSARR